MNQVFEEFFSKLESSTESKVALLSAMTSLPSVMLEVGRLNDEQYEQLLAAAEQRFCDVECTAIIKKILSEMRSVYA